MHRTKIVPPESHAQASCGAWRGREADPVDYKHPYPSMAQYAELLALRFDAKRTRHAYYRAMRVLHEHFQCDPATLEETHLRDYLLHIKLHKHWKPKTIRQTLACAKLFFVELLQRPLWRVFSQVRTKDHDFLPAVLTFLRVSRCMISRAPFAWGVIARLFHSSVDLDRIPEQWDQLVRVGASLRNRVVPAHIVLQRFEQRITV